MLACFVHAAAFCAVNKTNNVFAVRLSDSALPLPASHLVPDFSILRHQCIPGTGRQAWEAMRPAVVDVLPEHELLVGISVAGCLSHIGLHVHSNDMTACMITNMTPLHGEARMWPT